MRYRDHQRADLIQIEPNVICLPLCYYSSRFKTSTTKMNLPAPDQIMNANINLLLNVQILTVSRLKRG